MAHSLQVVVMCCDVAMPGSCRFCTCPSAKAKKSMAWVRVRRNNTKESAITNGHNFHKDQFQPRRAGRGSEHRAKCESMSERPSKEDDRDSVGSIERSCVIIIIISAEVAPSMPRCTM